MNMTVSIRARAHARADTVDVRKGFVVPRSITPSTPALARRGALRARWSADPVSGRLECRWMSDDDVPDSCRAVHGTTARELRGISVVGLAA